MANETPVVTSNVSSLPEVAGDAALLVDPVRRRVDCRRHPARGHRRAAAPDAHRTRPRAGRPLLVGEVRSGHAGRLPARAGSGVVRVALVHDWLTGMRGGEKALERLCELFPAAELFTLRPRQGLACRRSSKRGPSTPRSPSICRSWRGPTATTCRSSRRPSSGSTCAGFDLVVSCSHCVAKSVIVPPGVPPRLLLPDADALRVGPVRRVLRRRSGSAAWPARRCGR